MQLYDKNAKALNHKIRIWAAILSYQGFIVKYTKLSITPNTQQYQADVWMTIKDFWVIFHSYIVYWQDLCPLPQLRSPSTLS